MTDPLQTQRDVLAASFRGAGPEYDRYRPGFPPRAVEVIIPEPVPRVLDLGAGTGKFTEQLRGHADQVVAVDPSAQMLAVLQQKLPEVAALAGTAEHIPLSAHTADVVTVAQAFHWFDRERACAEIARVLVPGGRLGLVWNAADSGWDRACMQIAHPGLDTAPGQTPVGASTDLPGFTVLTSETVRWTERIDRADYLRRWLTVSSFLTAEPPQRAAMLAQIEQILDTTPETTGRARLDLQHATEVFVFRSLPVTSPGAGAPGAAERN